MVEEDTNIRTNVDTGPNKIRSRYTRPDTLMTCAMWIDKAQYITLKDFYDITLSNGTSLFLFDHPITEVPQEYRFEAPISWSVVGGETFLASMQWRQVTNK